MALFKLFKKGAKKTSSHRAVRHAKPRLKPNKVVKPKIPAVKPSVKPKAPVKMAKLEFNKMPDEKAYELLRRYRITLPDYSFCRNEEELKTSLKKIGFPCVMKVSGKSIIHKTNVDGVRLDIKSEDEAMKNFVELMKIKGAEKVLVQKMITEGYEIIVGGKKDPQFNRVVALGAGGILTEFMKDVSFRVSPLSRADAEEMLKEVKFSDLILKGFRGQKPANANSIIDVILSVSKIMESNADIKELDINPLFATPEAAIATDVRIILE